jgi:37-kD nucleoid-associated bacterial protein
MITAADLARLKIKRTIFHDVPNRPKILETKVILADLETKIDVGKAKILYDRITQVLGSKHAYAMHFSPAPATKVPDEVRAFTSKDRTTEEFIAMSRELANCLFAQHTGATSPGLLCVMEVAVGQKRGIAVLKLERQEGAEIKFSGEEGKRVFDFDVLENLILTDKTRLFKSALFVRTAPGDDDFDSHGCDSQGPGTSEDVARFWLTYLGCQLAEEPRVSTRKWFDASLAFANEEIGDPVQMNDFYEHIHSELKSNRKNVSPKQFIEDYVPAPLRVPYKKFLEEHRVSLQAFGKDISEIKTRLRKKAFHTSHGISVTVPEEEENLVKVKADQIVVHDNLVSVDHK